jgi:hypothetical protein
MTVDQARRIGSDETASHYQRHPANPGQEALSPSHVRRRARATENDAAQHHRIQRLEDERAKLVREQIEREGQAATLGRRRHHECGVASNIHQNNHTDPSCERRRRSSSSSSNKQPRSGHTNAPNESHSSASSNGDDGGNVPQCSSASSLCSSSHRDDTTLCACYDPREPEPDKGERVEVLALQKMLECSICLETMVDPVTLACGHNFCKSCLEALIIHSGSDAFNCPLDRYRFPRSYPLRTSITLQRILDMTCGNGFV